eukprot:scaffold123841_cov33-Tisochrysis_lutea.AAC.1
MLRARSGDSCGAAAAASHSDKEMLRAGGDASRLTCTAGMKREQRMGAEHQSRQYEESLNIIEHYR